MAFKKTFILFFAICIFLSSFLTFKCWANKIPTSQTAQKAIASVQESLKTELKAKGLVYGAPIFIRIFKKSSILEVWLKTKNGTFKKFKDYEICTFSGKLGPKLKRGDYQSPEGFYFVRPSQLNPYSNYRLAINLGYPNAYDRFHQRTGDGIMIHGNCVSAGCFAMTDPIIDEIYTLVVAAFKKGQPFVRVHVFPFHLSKENLAKYKSHPWHSFWQNLKEGYDHFEKYQKPPNAKVVLGKYVFSSEN